jgi:hypothetical protein
VKIFFGKFKSEIKKSGWVFFIIYIFLAVNLIFTKEAKGLLIGIIAILVAILFDFLKRNKNSKSPIIKIIQKIISVLKLVFVFLIGLGLTFLPDVGPIGVPWSFALTFGFFIFIFHIFYLIRDIRKKDILGIIWCLFVLIFYPVCLVFNEVLWDKGIKDMKKYSIQMHNECNLNKKCQNLKAPWTKDWQNVKIENKSFKAFIVHMETYYTFTGGIDQKLLLEVYNADIDFLGKNKKFYLYKDNNWIETNE